MIKAGLALLAAAWIFLAAGSAEAAPTGLNVSQSCSGNTANMTFTWRGVAATSRQVWIDLTTNDNWRAGTYVSAGPFAATDTAYLWSGIKANQLHHFRMTEQLASGSWVASVTSSFTAVCGSAPSTGATPEEQSYRNRATAQLTALAVRLAQSPRSSRLGAIATLNDFVTTLNGLEPVPPRFRDVHYQLRDVISEFVNCAGTPGTCSRAELENLLDELEDALEDYSLVVGI